jgi:ribosomal protein S18 acetylase RimI-like enzyme
MAGLGFRIAPLQAMKFAALTHMAQVFAIYQDRGVKTLTVQGIKKILAPNVRIGSICFFERDLRAPMPPLAPLEGIELREGSLSDIGLLHCLADARHQKNQALIRLEAGHHWYLSIEKQSGRLANYRWASMTSAFIPEINRTILLKPGEAYLYDLYTLPEFRRRGIEAVSRQFIYEELCKRYNAPRLFVYIRPENNASLQAGRNYLTPLARVWYLQFRDGETRLFMRNNPRMPELQAWNSNTNSGRFFSADT